MQYPIVSHRFIDHSLCNAVVDSHRHAASRASEIVDGDRIVMNARKRKSQTTFLFYNHAELHRIKNAVDAYMRDTHRVEQSSIQMTTYSPGDFFSSHIDALEPRQLDTFGPQRLWTAILYLDDDCVGGETCFPFLRRRITPEKGSLVCWPNVDDAGNIIRIHRHYSRSVSAGEKNILIFLYHTQLPTSPEYVPDQRGGDSVAIV